jgi:hypothetical protein
MPTLMKANCHREGFVINEKQIGSWAEDFLEKSKDGYVPAMLQKGGLEGWVQVELARQFQSLPGCINVQREQPIYVDPKMAVDFQIDYRQPDHTVGYTFVELKCESLFQSAELGRVTIDHTQHRLLAEDYEKLKYSRRQPFDNCCGCVLAIVFSDEARRGVENEKIFEDLLSADREIRRDHRTDQGRDSWNLTVYTFPV